MDDLKSAGGPQSALGVRSGEEELSLLSPSSLPRSSEVETASSIQGDATLAPLPARKRGRPTKAEAAQRAAEQVALKVVPTSEDDPSVNPTVEERLNRVLNDRGSSPPKNSKMLKVAKAYIALRLQGLGLAEISEQLDIPKLTIQTYVKRARQAGWLSYEMFSHQEDKLEVIKDLAVDNIKSFIDAKDKEMTIEVAKGTGIFKTHQVVKQDGEIAVGMALQVQVIMPPMGAIELRPGSIGGVPAINGEVVE